MCRVPLLVDFEFVVIADVIRCAIGKVDLFVGLLSRQVRLMEESREQDKIAQVHRKAKTDIHASDVAVDVAALQVLIRGYVDKATDHHLRKLQRSDHHRYRFRWPVPHRLKSVVGIHDRVDAVVHHDVPSRGRGVLRI